MYIGRDHSPNRSMEIVNIEGILRIGKVGAVAWKGVKWWSIFGKDYGDIYSVHIGRVTINGNFGEICVTTSVKRSWRLCWMWQGALDIGVSAETPIPRQCGRVEKKSISLIWLRVTGSTDGGYVDGGSWGWGWGWCWNTEHESGIHAWQEGSRISVRVWKSVVRSFGRLVGRSFVRSFSLSSRTTSHTQLLVNKSRWPQAREHFSSISMEGAPWRWSSRLSTIRDVRILQSCYTFLHARVSLYNTVQKFANSSMLSEQISFVCIYISTISFRTSFSALGTEK